MSILMVISRLGCQLRAKLSIFLLLLHLTESFGSMSAIDSFLLQVQAVFLNYQTLWTFFNSRYILIFWSILHGLFHFTRSEMREAFPKASDRASRVDEILQRAERDMYVHQRVPFNSSQVLIWLHSIDTPVNSPELTTPSTSISIEHDISTRLEEGEYFDVESSTLSIYN